MLERPAVGVELAVGIVFGAEAEAATGTGPDVDSPGEYTIGNQLCLQSLAWHPK